MNDSLTGQTTIIEPMTEQDISAIRLIEKEAHLSPWSAADYAGEIRNSDSICLVARIKNRIVGFLVSRLIMQSHSIEIYNIAVKTQFRNLKIGSELLNSLIKSSANNNLQEIWLEVRASNQTAILFYQKHGFKESYIRKSYYSNPVENALVMRKEIKY